MKTITENVSEPVYADFREHAKKTSRSTSELIREAMEEYRNRRIKGRRSVRDMQPLALQPRPEMLHAAEMTGDLHEEMLHDLRT